MRQFESMLPTDYIHLRLDRFVELYEEMSAKIVNYTEKIQEDLLSQFLPLFSQQIYQSLPDNVRSDPNSALKIICVINRYSHDIGLTS